MTRIAKKTNINSNDFMPFRSKNKNKVIARNEEQERLVEDENRGRNGWLWEN